MTPDERQLITGLFDRMKPIAGQQRDRDAEMLIGDQVRAQPYAPYLMAQTVIVQDQALRAANEKIQQLEVGRQEGPIGKPPGAGRHELPWWPRPFHLRWRGSFRPEHRRPRTRSRPPRLCAAAWLRPTTELRPSHPVDLGGRVLRPAVVACSAVAVVAAL